MADYVCAVCLKHCSQCAGHDVPTVDVVVTEAPLEQVRSLLDSIQAKDRRIAELEAALCGIHALRMRIHFAEKHNQHFERCESAWCNPSPDEDPAKECIDALLAQAWREALEDLKSEVLSIASNAGIYDGECPQSALDAIEAELSGYSRLMWRLLDLCGSASARPDDVYASVQSAVAREVK